jgi:cell wall assembly regulator SMI1
MALIRDSLGAHNGIDWADSCFDTLTEVLTVTVRDEDASTVLVFERGATLQHIWFDVLMAKRRLEQTNEVAKELKR